jgi:hypothetical protein
MKITKQELRKMIMEELENEVMSLNEEDGYQDYLAGDGPEAQRLAGEDEGNQKRAAEAKARQDQKNGAADAKETTKPKEPDNKDYMRGFLLSRKEVLDGMIRKYEDIKREYSNPFAAKPIIDKLDRMRRERIILKGIFPEEDFKDGIFVGAFDDSAWMNKYGKSLRKSTDQDRTSPSFLQKLLKKLGKNK